LSNPRPEIGRFCDLEEVEERSDITLETDLRKPEYRRETFLRFYEAHLKWRAHPGIVYALFPALTRRLELNQDQQMYLAYLNGNTQNPVMSYIILSKYPTPEAFVNGDGDVWFNKEWARFQFDTDRRYQKRDLVKNLKWYVGETKHHQWDYFEGLASLGFQEAWKYIRKHFPTFGRLSAFSYMEYLRIMGVSIECDDLFLEDMEGSRSHRNGLAKVLGRDDLDFADKKIKPTYALGQLDWLKEEAELLLAEAQKRFRGRDFYEDTGNFSMESTLCTYKSWHRENRRYANVYSDMLHDRIIWAEAKWPEVDFSIFWDIRREALPAPFRLEDNPRDVGVKSQKQNVYRLTGRPVMLGYVWEEMWSSYETMVTGQTAEEWHGEHDPI
jgi:hypothetical protein